MPGLTLGHKLPSLMVQRLEKSAQGMCPGPRSLQVSVKPWASIRGLVAVAAASVHPVRLENSNRFDAGMFTFWAHVSCSWAAAWST